MFHEKQHIIDLPKICSRLGLTNIIMTPGSRNAPLIDAFVKHTAVHTNNLVDERSAAFYALGMSQSLQKPVGIVCTSGSAVLNLAPAIAEAYYQQIPLVVITADRPAEWIDQNDNQTLRQNGIYKNYIKKSVSLPQEINSNDDLWYAHRLICEAIQCAISGNKGPVHINIPIKEPLYNLSGKISDNINIIKQSASSASFYDAGIKKKLGKYKKIMVVCGQSVYSKEMSHVLNQLAIKGIVVIAENIGNIKGQNILQNPEPLILGINEKEKIIYYPDLVISFGGQVVSKGLKAFLKLFKTDHWYVSPDGKFIDTYQQLTHVVKSEVPAFFDFILALELKQDRSFYSCWNNIQKTIFEKMEKYFSTIRFSDMFVFDSILKSVPLNSVVQLGASTPVRYAELVGNGEDLEYYSNRGVSGIDGCVSTAAGFAKATLKPVTLIVGDLSFVYDSNALWNKSFPNNLKIIVINNQGGGIFRLINDPEKIDILEEYQETNHPVNIQKLVESFGVLYDFCQSENELTSKLEKLYSSSNAMVLEVKTPKVKNAGVYRNYYQYLKS